MTMFSLFLVGNNEEASPPTLGFPAHLCPWHLDRSRGLLRSAATVEMEALHYDEAADDD